jgi:AcrR family transcriptional regulator
LTSGEEPAVPKSTDSNGSEEPVATRAKRRPQRRDEILEAAVRLFHENGYHSTGIDDIGAAAGITGPAIYRHFKSKEDILETLLAQSSTEALERARSIVDGADTPLDALRGLVDLYVGVILDNPALAFVLMYERRTLRGETRSTVDRTQRMHFEEWVHALAQVRPELSDTEARVMVQGMNGLIVSAASYRSGLDKESLQPLIADMVLHGFSLPRSVRPRRGARTSQAAAG